MRRLLYFICLPLLFCISCEEKIKTSPAYIWLDKTEIVFDNAQDTIKLELKTSRNWEVSDMPDWITVKPASGSVSEKISIEAASNENQEPRDTEIYFSLKDNQKATLNIHQN